MIALIRRAALGVMAAAFLGAGAHAQAADPNRLFADSELVVRDRFSDEIVGKGPEVVFIPGLASSRATWKASAERLRAHYRVHLLQIAGFSGEPARANAQGEVVAPTAEAIDAYLVEQKLTPAVVVSHSLGGALTLYLAEQHPQHIKKALVVDALPFFAMKAAGPKATVEGIRPLATMMRNQAANDEQFKKLMGGQVAHMAVAAADRETIMNWTLASDRDVVARAFYEDLLLDMRPDLGKIAAPIVLLYPDNAPFGAAPDALDPMYQAAFAPAPSVKLQRIGDAAHFIMFDQPAAFAAALDAFLGR